ncbi:hypothetical protein [Fretibacter rubidus]|uniref:hypothetical protein n=1 Tax=Fretibacter rubidus TaxID=570162 RepID=UPI00352B775D
MAFSTPKLIGFGLGAMAIAMALITYSRVSDKAITPVEQPSSDESQMPMSEDSVQGEEIMRIADIDFLSYSKDLARWVELDTMEPLESAVAKIETYFSPQGGDINDYDVRQTGTQTESIFSSFDAEGGKVVLVERINMRDDSVKAQQFYAVFKKTDTTEVLIDYGMKIKCARGDNTTDWQTDNCP